MNTSIQLAEIYQSALQLTCSIERWSESLSCRRLDIDGALAKATIDTVTALGEAVSNCGHGRQQTMLGQAASNLQTISALVDICGVLHLTAPVDLQGTRKIIRRLTQQIDGAKSAEPSPFVRNAVVR